MRQQGLLPDCRNNFFWGFPMAFQRTKVASALGLLLGAGGASILASPALAQDIRVEVTGSSIGRVEADGALPVQVYTRA